MSEVAALLDEIAASRRPIELQVVANKAATTLSPDQVAALYMAVGEARFAELRAEFRKYAHGWQYYRRGMNPIGGAPRVFRNTQLSAGGRLFESEGRVAAKVLLVIFTGSVGRVMMPIPQFLDALPPVPIDVLLLRNDSERHYRSGVVGFGSSLWRTALAVKSRFVSKGYRRVIVLGTSSGGLPALCVANQIGADLGIAVGGRFPYDLFRLKELRGFGATGFGPMCDCMFSGNVPMKAFFDHAHEDDKFDAQHAARIIPGLRLVPVHDVDTHLIFGAMFKQGRLPTFLADLLEIAPVPVRGAGLFSGLRLKLQG